MRDTVITSVRKKNELKIFLLCLSLAYLLNIVSILVYHSSWIELITMIGYVFGISIVFYVFGIIIRLLLHCARKTVRKLSEK